MHVGLHALRSYDDASADTFVGRVVVGQYRRLAVLLFDLTEYLQNDTCE